jgi:hypothetical protein
LKLGVLLSSGGGVVQIWKIREAHFATESVRYFHGTAARDAVATELLLTWQMSVETL